ncbi:MAG: sodium:proton antiporter [Thermomicrobiales bacterium]
MNVVFSLGVAILFGAGCYLLLKRDLIRLIVGITLIGNAANLFIMSASLQRGAAPVLPLDGPFADPIVQSMTLTAIVISFSVSTLMLALVYRVYEAHAAVDLDQLTIAEEEDLVRDESAFASSENNYLNEQVADAVARATERASR